MTRFEKYHDDALDFRNGGRDVVTGVMAQLRSNAAVSNKTDEANNDMKGPIEDLLKPSAIAAWVAPDHDNSMRTKNRPDHAFRIADLF
jgi:hypothetical protein